MFHSFETRQLHKPDSENISQRQLKFQATLSVELFKESCAQVVSSHRTRQDAEYQTISLCLCWEAARFEPSTLVNIIVVVVRNNKTSDVGAPFSHAEFHTLLCGPAYKNYQFNVIENINHAK